MATTTSRTDILDAASNAVWDAIRALADAAEHWQALVEASINPDSAEIAEVLAMAVEWRDDVNAARRYLAGHHRLVSS